MLNNSYILIKEKQEMIEQNKKLYFVLISGIKDDKKKVGWKMGQKSRLSINSFYFYAYACVRVCKYLECSCETLVFLMVQPSCG